MPIPPWLALARLDLGLHELDKNGDLHARVRDMFKHTTYPPSMITKKTAWCSAAICKWMENAHIRSTRSAAAASWAGWGEECMAKPGAVIVFGKADPDAGGTGHVALFERWDDDKAFLWVLGANQNNQVCVAKRPTERIVACRWPVNS